MSTPANKEMRELDDFCAEFVMLWKRTEHPDELTTTDETLFWHRMANAKQSETVAVGTAYKAYGSELFSHSWKTFRPTDREADAGKVLVRCAIKRTESWDVYRPDVTLAIHAPRPEWNNLWVIQSDAEGTITAQAETFQLAIAKFAVALFSGK